MGGWGDGGMGRWGDGETRGRINYFLTPYYFPNALCPMPNSQFSIQATILIGKINRIY